MSTLNRVPAIVGWVVARANRRMQELYRRLDRMQEKLEHLDELPAIKALVVEDIAQVRERIEERARRE